MAMELIETIELTASAASIEFTSIPQDGVDLLLVTSTRQDASGVNIGFIQFNSSTANYLVRWLEGSGTSAQSNASTTNYAALVQGTASTSNTFTNNSIYVSNYTSSANKSYSVDSVTENNGASAFIHLQAGAWSDTSAISSVKILPDTGANFVQYTSASIYKIS